MTSRPDAPARKSAWLGVAALLAVLLGFAAWDAVVRSRDLLDSSSRYGVTVDAPPQNAASPTGYADGRRSLLLPAPDTAHWVMQTQAMVAAGDWRSRHAGYDNAPEGREVHWAGPVHWWLAGLAWIDHLATGRPTGLAIERATLTAGPAMLALLLLGFMPWLGRKFSPLTAGFAALALVAFYPSYADYLPGRTDHHAWVNICCLLTVLGLVGGTMADNRAAARRWLAGSAVAGGVGLWISAATLVPVLVGLGLGTLAASRPGLVAKRRPAWLDDPGLLRFWGLVGGGVSFATWLIEYLPALPGLRLEVNHPLYAAAWIGAGEALRVAVLALRDGVRTMSRRAQITGGIGVMFVALLPAIIVATQARTFVVADPFVWQLHSLYISEFRALPETLAAAGLSWASVALVLPVLLLAPPLWLLLRPSTLPEIRAQLALALVPALLGWALGCYQVRWLGLACLLAVPPLTVFSRALESSGASRRALAAWTVALGLLFVPGAIAAVQRTLASTEVTPARIHALVERDVAHWLRQRSGRGRVVVAGSPTPTTNLIFLGGLEGLGTLYWENAAGLKKAAALFGAPSPEAARELAARFGVTHIVLFSWDAFEVYLGKLHRGLSADAPIPADLFAAQLLSAPVPPAWLRPVPFVLPTALAGQGTQVRIWEVVPEQTPAVAAARAAGYYLEMGQSAVAARYLPALAGFPHDLAANALVAAIAATEGNQAAFGPAFARVLAQLPQADTLALPESVQLAVVLAIGRRPDLARSQLQRAVQQADESSLRHLTPGPLAILLMLTQDLGVPWPDPALPQLGRSLVPPNLRR